jgi:hypothetical protein
MRPTPIILTVAALATSASAQELITNGSFESGLASWTIADQLGSDGTFHLQSAATSPVNAFPVPTPPHGLRAAMTDQTAGGSHVLYQDITIPSVVPVGSISFSLYVNNGAGAFFTPAHLDWAATSPTGSQVLNQQSRVDFITTTANPFSTAPGDVLLNIFQTPTGSPSTFGYTTSTTDITSFLQARAGQTIRLRFAEVDNVSFFNMGVDNVSITIPAPAAAPLLAALTLNRRRRSMH